MADVFTGATSAAGSGQLTNQVLTAYQRVAMNALRADTQFDQLAKVKPGDLTSPGNPVKFLFWDDMTAATTPLNEVTDVDTVGLSDSLVTVTPAEYGNAIQLTKRIQTDDFLIGFDADVAELLAWNMVDTIDTLAQAVVDAGGTEVIVDGGTEAALTAGDVLTVAAVRARRAALAKGNVRKWDSSHYGTIIHPDPLVDLKNETGDGAWAATSSYSAPMNIWNDEVGAYAGFRFIESPRAKLNADGGASAVDTYTTYFFGQEFLAKAESIAPHLVLSPQTDRLRRFQPLAWHAYVGWAILRSAALYRVISASSIGANT
jgi:N4-gp56 family major capsid protein